MVNHYSAPSVVFVRRIVLIASPGVHSGPRIVFARYASALGMSVSGATFFNLFDI